MNIFVEVFESFRLKSIMKKLKKQGISNDDLYYTMMGEVDNADLRKDTKENIMKDIKRELKINEIL